MTTAHHTDTAHHTGRPDLSQLLGVGGAPDATVEWVIGARLTLTSEAHIGGPADMLDPDGPVDQPLDRDPGTGQPRLRLTTLVGLLRHRLQDSLDGYTDTPDTITDSTSGMVADLYGSPEAGSALTGCDITLDLPAPIGVLLRPHNHVNPDTGAAQPGAYWYTQHLPAGTTGLLHLRLRTTPTGEAALLAMLHRSAGPAPDGSTLRVGARTRTGQGELALTHWVAHRHDLNTPAGWAAVHGPDWDEHSNHLRAAVNTATHPNLAAAVTAAAPHLTDPLRNWQQQHPDQRRLDTVTLTLRIGQQHDPQHPDPDTVRAGLLRVGDLPRADQPGATDLTHRTTPRVNSDHTVTPLPVLGTPSLLAVLKTAAAKAVSVTPHPEYGRAWWRTWWGSDPTDPGPPIPARISGTEAIVTDTHPLIRGRSSLDTLFGDAADEHLFDETVLAGGQATLTLTVRDPDDAIRGQLLLLICDLISWSPHPLGGGGHGSFTATAVTWQSTTGDPPMDWIDLLTNPTHPGRDDAARWMGAYHAALTPTPDGRS